MKNLKVLIIADNGSQSYWKALSGEIKKRIGPVRIVQIKELSQRMADQPYDVVVMDIADGNELHRMIPEVHQKQPRSRIVAASTTPTWKQTREVIRLGAQMIRKSANPDEVIDELRPRQNGAP